MCYPKPGPRCSSHAKAEVDRIEKELINFPSTTANLDPQEAFQFYEELVASKKVALDKFYTTPAGQDYLDTQIAHAKTNTEADFFVLKRDTGVKERQQALNAYKKTQKNWIPKGWSITETTTKGSTEYLVEKPGIMLTVKNDPNEDTETCSMTGTVYGKPATLINGSEDGINENLYAKLGISAGVQDPLGLLTPASNIGLKEKEITDLLKVATYYQKHTS